MRGRLGALGLLLATASGAAAQSADVRGTVVDSAAAPVEGAMVVALTLPDSVLATYDLSDGDGRFRLSGLPPGSFLLQVTRVGFHTLYRPFTTEGMALDVGTVGLRTAAEEIDPLTVSVERVPFLARGDTLAYNAAAFFTRPNASVEDLLRQLPGIEVDDDGSIRAQGEDVEKVLVDGKEFFGGETTVATRNLPADAVERVDVYDRPSDMAEFTGIDDGEEERTIDLRLKEDAKTGYFGRVEGSVGGGLGADGDFGGGRARYDQALNLNRFSPDVQLAAVVNVNNVGRSGNRSFSARGSGGNGHTETRTVALNASREFAEGRSLRASYVLGSTDALREEASQQQFLLGADLGAVQASETDTRSGSRSHGVELSGDYAFADDHQLRLRSSFSLSSTDGSWFSSQQTEDASGTLRNSAVTQRDTEADNLRGSAALTWRRRFDESGRSLVAEASATLSRPDDVTRLTSTTVDPALPDPTDVVQEQVDDGRTLTLRQRLSFLQPLGDDHTLEVFGVRRTVDERSDRATVDLGEAGPVINDLLSSTFERAHAWWEGGARLSRNTESARIQVGLEVQRTDLQGTVLDGDRTIRSSFTSVLPEASLRKQFGNSKTFSMRYSTTTREPSVRQLQPLVDNRDPLNVYVGNPELAPEYRHSVQSDFRLFDQFSFINLFTYARATWTRDDIVDSRTTDASGVRTVTPVNADRGWSATGGANFGAPIRRLGIKATLDYGVTRTNSASFVDGEPNRGRSWSHAVGLSVDNRTKERFDVRVGARLGFNSVDYSLADRLDQSWLDRSLSGSGSVFFGPWTLTSDLSARFPDASVLRGSGDDTVVRWNAAVSRNALDDRLEVHLGAFDLLDRNRGVNVRNTASYIEERRSRSVGRTLMLQLTWQLGARGGGFGRR